MDNKTRLFFVVEGMETSEEIFETLEEAEKFYKQSDPEDKPILYIAIVRNAYKEPDTKTWNYEDQSDTFEIIKMLKDEEKIK